MLPFLMGAQWSERDLKTIINTFPTTAWSTGPDGYVEFLSDRWLDYAGITAEEGAGQGWGKVIHPELLGDIFSLGGEVKPSAAQTAAGT